MKNLAYKQYIFEIVAAGLLIAIGILIPMVSPLRIIIPPASYTLGVHVPIFIAMFISPRVAIAVAIGTTAGFFMGGFPLVIVLRAASHLLYVIPGALFLSKIDKFNFRGVRLRVFSLVMALIHAVAETAAVLFFFMGTSFPEGQGVLWVLGFVGLGTIIHSMFDLEIANIVRVALHKQKSLRKQLGA
ncbi:MAG: hypothetical protein FWC67_04775 [Defluviitaleaceae bacterium]|nr:hypothetical protein [Defluviitaleaceae bacterium]